MNKIDEIPRNPTIKTELLTLIEELHKSVEQQVVLRPLVSSPFVEATQIELHPLVTALTPATIASALFLKNN